MNKSRRVACWLALVLAGCTSSQPAAFAPKAPHGGLLRQLPDGQGSVEVVRDEAADKPGQATLKAYYYDAALKPISPSPTSASLKSHDRRAGTIELKPVGDTLTSAPFTTDGGVEGVLSATVGGKPTAVPISLR